MSYIIVKQIPSASKEPVFVVVEGDVICYESGKEMSKVQIEYERQQGNTVTIMNSVFQIFRSNSTEEFFAVYFPASFVKSEDKSGNIYEAAETVEAESEIKALEIAARK